MEVWIFEGKARRGFVAVHAELEAVGQERVVDVLLDLQLVDGGMGREDGKQARGIEKNPGNGLIQGIDAIFVERVPNCVVNFKVILIGLGRQSALEERHA